MASPTKWYLKSYAYSWSGNDKTITVQTDRPCHLWLKHTTDKPKMRLDSRQVRGVWIYCKPTWLWRNTIDVEQDEAGDTTTHTFHIYNWLDYETVYYFFYGTIGGTYYGSNTAPIQQTYIPSPIPPGPFPTPTPVQIPILNSIVYAGKRYIQYHNGSYFILVPTPTSLTLWKYDGTNLTRLNQGNEPLPSVGVIWGADSRLSSDGATLQVAYLCRPAALGPHYIRYVQARLDFELWGASEPVFTANCGTIQLTHPLIELSLSDTPRVFFGHSPGTISDVYDSQKSGGVWGTPNPVLTLGSRNIAPNSVAIHRTTGAKAVVGVNTVGYMVYRHRIAGGPWGTEYFYPTPGSTDDHQSIIYPDLPHEGWMIPSPGPADHGYGNPPSTWEGMPDTTNHYSPSICALGANHDDRYMVVGRSGAGIYTYHQVLPPFWDGPTLLLPNLFNRLSAQRMDATTLALLHRGTATLNPTFYAWQP